ncbi:cytosolic non-specific dipeptidase-like [Scaptodrosophila lebanonensis]|uniref:Cytosolic non-specific dipeptidase-like n=1 Tax=Drosophila lebanonensis TaxID=7225 RepID=A0A6J2TY27_DROLE|nr:cytosolic non-specific dipeptidase-like [Scaptodrosophila lebanonensis]
MICWGDRRNCGVLLLEDDEGTTERCRCIRDECIDDLPLDKRQRPKETEFKKVLRNLDNRTTKDLRQLNDILAIKSVCKGADYGEQRKIAIETIEKTLQALDFEVEVVEIGSDVDKGADRHFVIFADYFSTPIKNTILVYGNVDVMPITEREAKKWIHDPYKLTQKMGTLYGHGVATSKGPILCWIQAVSAWMEETRDLPVNFRFIIDTNHNNGCSGLTALFDERPDFFLPVDLVICCTNHWISEHMALISTSHSGYIHFSLEVMEDPTKEGGREPLADLSLLLNSLVDEKNNIRVPNIDRHVRPLTHSDYIILTKTEYGISEHKTNMGASRLPHDSCKAEMLKHMWCKPSLSINSVDAKFCNSSRDLYYPKKATATFTIKIIPDQSIDYIFYQVSEYLNDVYKKNCCKSIANLRVVEKLHPLHEPRHSPVDLAAKDAFNRVYGRETAHSENICICIPILNKLRRYCSKDSHALPLPFCSTHTRPNRPNESIPEVMYVKNRLLFATLMYEVGQIPAFCKCRRIRNYCRLHGKTKEVDYTRVVDVRKQLNTYLVNEYEQNRIVQFKDSDVPTARDTLLQGISKELD